MSARVIFQNISHSVHFFVQNPLTSSPLPSVWTASPRDLRARMCIFSLTSQPTALSLACYTQARSSGPLYSFLWLRQSPLQMSTWLPKFLPGLYSNVPLVRPSWSLLLKTVLFLSLFYCSPEKLSPYNGMCVLFAYVFPNKAFHNSKYFCLLCSRKCP